MALTKISTAMISQSAAAVDLNVDAGTFYVDTTNNRVGVGGKTDPDTPLHVVGTATATLFAGSGASLTNIPNSALTNSSITINSNAVSLGGSLTLTTANIGENTNLYYTDARADARIAAADTDDLSEGSSNLYYTDARVDARVSGGSLGNITTTGYIRGPSSFTIDPAAHGDNTGTVVIAGNLQVDGTTTTINSTTMTVDDKNITLASGSANAAAASGAGFTVDIGTGTNPTITYDGTNDEWDFNKNVDITGTVTSDDLIKVQNAAGTAAAEVDIVSGATWTLRSNPTSGTNSYGLDIIKGSAGTDVKMSIDSNGNVGIGTASPTNSTNLKTLDIKGTNGGQLLLGRSSVFDFFAFSSSSSTSIGTATGQDLIIRTNSNGGNNERMRILSNGGIGFGTDTPTSFGGGSFEFSDTSSVQTGVRITSSSGSSEIGVDSAGTYIQSITDGDGISFYTSNGGTANVYAMRIDHNGEVGIGTSSPSTNLHVNGSDATIRISGDNSMTFHQDSAWNSNMYFGAHYNGSNVVYGATGRGAFKISSYHDGDVSPQYIAFYGANSGTSGNTITWNSVGFAQDEDGNVGIATTSPTDKLDVAGALRLTANISFDSNKSGRIYKASNHGLAFHGVTGTENDFAMFTPAGQLMVVNPTGTNNVSLVPSAAGSVGIGTASPAQKLHIKDTSTSGGILLTRESSNAGAYLGLKYQHSPTDSSFYSEILFRQVDANHGGQIEFWTDNSVGSPVQRMVINKSGHVGIKTTPSAWGTDYAVLDLNTGGSIYGTTSGVSTASNLYFTGSAWLAKTTGLGTLYAQHTGKHLWYSSASATAGGSAALSQKMELDASGRLGINRTPSISNSKLEVGGADNVSLINVEASGNTGGIGIGSTGLQFFHGSSSKMTISSSGNVITGTTTNSYPKGKFTIHVSPGTPATSGTSTTNVGFRLGTTTGNSQVLDMGVYNASPYGSWIQTSGAGEMSATSPLILNPNGGRVGIGGIPAENDTLTVTTTGTTGSLRLVNSNTGSGSTRLVIENSSTSPAANDGIGEIQFIGKNTAGNANGAAYVSVIAEDVTNGSYDSSMNISTLVAGYIRNRIRFTPTQTVVNEDSQALNFRVESNNNDNMIHVDGTNDRVGIGRVPATHPLEVQGHADFISGATIAGSVGIGTTASPYKLNVNGETKTLGLYSAGTTNLGTNGGSNVSDKTILAGYGVLAGNGTRYGNYGSLIFRSSSGYTAGARSFLITNGYDANKFAIIQSSTHTTIPNIDGAGGGATDGTPIFVINNSGQIGMNTGDPGAQLHVIGKVKIDQGQVWDATTQGLATGSIHLDPNSASDNAGGAITFGASDTANGTNTQAGIYIRSDGAYGTNMYLSTTDSYAVGSKTSMSIDHYGNVHLPRGHFTSQVPAFNAYYNGNSFSPGGNYIFAANTARFNNGGHFNTSTYRFTAPVAGVYRFYFRTITNGSASNQHVVFRKNGSDISGTNQHFSPNSGSLWCQLELATLQDLADGDYIDVRFVTLSIAIHGNAWNEFSGHLVG